MSLANIFLDFVALLIERLVIGQRDFPAFGGGYAGLAASFGESIPEPIAIITTVGKKLAGGRASRISRAPL